MQIPANIKPSSEEELNRWQAQGKGWRLLHGEHLEDVREEIAASFAKEVAVNLQINPDLSRNPLRLIAAEMNVIYDSDPEVSINGMDIDEFDKKYIMPPELWPLSQERQRVVLGIGECLTRLDWCEEKQRIKMRIVNPSTVTVFAHPDDPSIAVEVRELRRRRVAGEITWVWEIWNILDSENPVFKIIAIDEVNGTESEVTGLVMKDPSIYPYMYDDKGILPYVLHHKKVQDKLWDWHSSSELVHGSLRTAALWSHWTDGFISAAHPIHIAIDLDSPAGVSQNVAGTPIKVVPIDRTSIPMFKSTHSDRSGSISTLAPTLDVQTSIDGLREYERGLAVYAGLSPGDLQITSGQSGYAIALNQGGKRHARRYQIPAAQMGDQILIATSAKIAMSRMTGLNLSSNPEDYNIKYSMTAVDSTEMKERIELAKMKLEAGLITEVDALMEINPDLTKEQAISQFLQNIEINAIIAKAKQNTEGNASQIFTNDVQSVETKQNTNDMIQGE